MVQRVCGICLERLVLRQLILSVMMFSVFDGNIENLMVGWFVMRMHLPVRSFHDVVLIRAHSFLITAEFRAQPRNLCLYRGIWIFTAEFFHGIRLFAVEFYVFHSNNFFHRT